MKKRIISIIAAILLTVTVFTLPILNPGPDGSGNKNDSISRADTIIDNHKKTDNTAPEKINIPKSDTTVTFLITVEGDSLYDTISKSSGKYRTVYELLHSDDYRRYTDAVRKSQAIAKASIERIISEADFDGCYCYNTVINGFSVRAPYSSLERLKKITGVTSVNPVFTNYLTISEYDDDYQDYYDYDNYSDDDYDYGYEPETDYGTDDYISDEENTDEDSSGEESSQQESSEEADEPFAYQAMTDSAEAAAAGYTGSGKVIAVIDNGFDCSEKALSAEISSGRMTAADIKTIADRSALNIADSSSLTKSSKVVFAYDYADLDSDTFSPYSSHGTKVASLAAAADGGIAADAQLVLMKVCSDKGREAGDDVFLAALDDIAKLSPDILNISLGLQRSTPSCKLTEKALEEISLMGTMICSSAGNDSENVFSKNEKGISADYTDYGTISYPSSLENVLSSASVDCSYAYYDYIQSEEGSRFPYADIISSDGTEIMNFNPEAEEMEYIYMDNYGEAEDYTDVDVKDKLVIINRGGIPFTDKIRYASVKGAAGIMIISDQPLYVSFKSEYGRIPSAALDSSASSYFRENSSGKISFGSDGRFDISSGASPSEFTSPGVTSDLRLKPDISAPGTDIITPADETASHFTGTSASSAITAGACAVVSQYAQSLTPDNSALSPLVTSAILMNTAVPSKYDDDVYYSPRYQGSGVLNIKNALSTKVCVTDNNYTASLSLGDSTEGEFTFSMVIRNFSDKPRKFDLSYKVQSDKMTVDNEKVYNTLTPSDITSEASVSFKSGEKEINSVTAKANDDTVVEGTLELSPQLMVYLDTLSGNGMYIDGFLFLTPEDNEGCELSVPFMGYYGSWSCIDIFDNTIYDAPSDPAIGSGSIKACITDAEGLKSAEAGKNIFTGRSDKKTISIGRDTVKNIYDLPANSSSFLIPDLYLLRDAADYTITIKDSGGNVLYEKNIGNVSSFAGSGHEPYVGLLNSFNSDSLSNLFSELSEGSYTYTVKASTIDSQGGSGDAQTMSYSFTVDNTAPEKPTAEIISDNDRVLLKLSAKDNNLMQGFVLYTADAYGSAMSYSDRLDALVENGYIHDTAYKLVSADINGKSAEFVYDITELYSSLLSLESYAESNGMNVPEPSKIFVRSADASFNLSVPTLCGTVVPSEVTFVFKDRKGNPVEGAEVVLSGQRLKSDKAGKLTFTGLITDIYGAKLTALPANYKSSKNLFLIEISNSSYKPRLELILDYTGSEPVVERTEGQTSSGELSEVSQQSESGDALSSNEDIDDSTFAIIFIGAMLLISAASLLLSRMNRGYDYFMTEDTEEENEEK